MLIGLFHKTCYYHAGTVAKSRGVIVYNLLKKSMQMITVIHALIYDQVPRCSLDIKLIVVPDLIS